MLQVFSVIPKIWCLRRPSYLTCSYMVETEAGLVFIDAGMSSGGSDVSAALRAPDRSETEVAAAILTHWHNDHSGGAKYLEEKCGASIYCHPYEGEKLTNVAKTSFLAKVSRYVPEVGPLVLLRGLLNDGPAVTIKSFRAAHDGDVILDQFTVVSTPGHTPGHISVWDKVNRVLFSGDALAVVRGEIRFMARPVTEDLPAARASMLRLTEFSVETICPGHRAPLAQAAPHLKALRKRLQNSSTWPLLG